MKELNQRAYEFILMCLAKVSDGRPSAAELLGDDFLVQNDEDLQEVDMFFR